MTLPEVPLWAAAAFSGLSVLIEVVVLAHASGAKETRR